MSEKTSGYTLLILGIILMIFSTVQILLIFTGKSKPMSLFNTETNQSSSFNPQDLLKQFQNPTGSSTGIPNIQLINSKTIDNILNLTVYYLIMQFLLSLGFKLASLGIQLLRPIVVQMKNRTFVEAKQESHIN